MNGTLTPLRAWLLMLPLLAIMLSVIGWPFVRLSCTSTPIPSTWMSSSSFGMPSIRRPAPAAEGTDM